MDGFPWELWVIPEDENIEEVVNGFHAGMDRIVNQRWKVLPVAKGRGLYRQYHGWKGAVQAIENCNLQTHPKRHVLLVIDFDQSYADWDPKDPDRFAQVERKLKQLGLDNFRDRIHVLVISEQSEDLKKVKWEEACVDLGSCDVGTFDGIGRFLAILCKARNFALWDNDPVLCCNGEELGKMQKTVCINLSIPCSHEDQILS